MKIFDELKGEKGAYFAGGIAAAVLLKKVLKSKSVHDIAVNAVAGGMKLQKEASYQLETIKEDAEDLVRQDEIAKAEANE